MLVSSKYSEYHSPPYLILRVSWIIQDEQSNIVNEKISFKNRKNIYILGSPRVFKRAVWTHHLLMFQQL